MRTAWVVSEPFGVNLTLVAQGQPLPPQGEPLNQHLHRIIDYGRDGFGGGASFSRP